MHRTKLRQQSPLTKCRSNNRITRFRKKKIHGTFTADINVEDFCDETSSMENGSSSITNAESKTTEILDDVFGSCQNKSPSEKQSDEWSLTHLREDLPESPKEGAEEMLSSPETFRRSERQQDEWGLGHLNEDPITNPKKNSVDDILSTPKKRTSSASDEPTNTILFSGGIDPFEINPVASIFERFEELSSIQPCNINNRPEFQCQTETEEKSKLIKQGSKRRRKKILNSTRIDGYYGMPCFEELDDISSISCNMSCSTKDKQQHDLGGKSVSSKKGMTSEKFLGSITLHGVQEQKSLKSKTFIPDVPKSNSFEIHRTLPEEPNVLQSVTLIPSNKSMEALHRANDEGEICETPKNARVGNFYKRRILLNGKLRQKASKENVLRKFEKEKAFELKKNSPDTVKNVCDTLSSTQVNVPLIDPLIDESGRTIRTPSLKSSKENKDKSPTVMNDDGQSKKTAASKLVKRKSTPYKKNAKAHSLKKKLRQTTVSLVPVTEHIVLTESIGNSKTQSSAVTGKKSKFSKGAVFDNGKYFKKSATTQLLKKIKDLQERKSKREENILSTNTTSLPIKDFIVPTESEGNISVHSSRISSSNLDKSLGNAADDEGSLYFLEPERTTKNHPLNRLFDASSKEDLISTPSSTTHTEGSVEYMDDTQSNENVSERSTEKFLEENNLYESEYSTEKENSKLQKRKQNARKKKLEKDSWEGKSLSEKLREYKEYLKTIPYDDLSLKKWRLKERNNKK